MSPALENSMRKATHLQKVGKNVEALAILKELKFEFPENPRVENRYNDVERKIVRAVAGEEPPQNVIEHLQSLHRNKEFRLVVKKCTLALKGQPKSTFLWNMLGLAKLELNDTKGGIADIKKALALNPFYYGALLNYSRGLKDIGEPKSAIKPLLKAKNLKPDREDAYNNLGGVYEQLNKDKEAEFNLKKAIEIRPDYANARHTLGIVQLKNYRFAEGWEYIESRFETEHFDSKRTISSEQSQWNGEKVGTLFAWAEQGVGDEAMFASAYSDLLKRCDKLLVSATDRMIPALSRSFRSENIEFFDRKEALTNIPSFDAHAPMMTAVGKVRPDLSSFREAGCAFLCADPTRFNKIREELRKASGGRPIYGISWFSLAKWFGSQRSVKLHKLVKCLPENAYLVSLQYGNFSEDLEKLKRDHGVEVHSVKSVNNFVDLEGLFALISACDRVVSIDNSTVHFAGALGVPCDVVLPFNASWRWGSNGSKTSYWFDSLRLHWQPSQGDWQTTFNHLKSNFDG